MAKSKNHTCHNQTRKAHRNGEDGSAARKIGGKCKAAFREMWGTSFCSLVGASPGGGRCPRAPPPRLACRAHGSGHVIARLRRARAPGTRGIVASGRGPVPTTHPHAVAAASRATPRHDEGPPATSARCFACAHARTPVRSGAAAWEAGRARARATRASVRAGARVDSREGGPLLALPVLSRPLAVAVDEGTPSARTPPAHAGHQPRPRILSLTAGGTHAQLHGHTRLLTTSPPTSPPLPPPSPSQASSAPSSSATAPPAASTPSTCGMRATRSRAPCWPAPSPRPSKG
jgi:hypothetical protein